MLHTVIYYTCIYCYYRHLCQATNTNIIYKYASIQRMTVDEYNNIGILLERGIIYKCNRSLIAGTAYWPDSIFYRLIMQKFTTMLFRLLIPPRDFESRVYAGSSRRMRISSFRLEGSSVVFPSCSSPARESQLFIKYLETRQSHGFTRLSVRVAHGIRCYFVFELHRELSREIVRIA